MGRMALFGALLSLTLGVAAAVCAADAVRARAVRGYAAGEARMARAGTLHLKVKNALDRGAVTEYWFRTPNKFRIDYPDGAGVRCDGDTMTTLDAKGKRSRAKAPREVPQDYRPIDFRSFFEREPVIGKIRSLEQFSFGGGQRRAWWVQTTESAIMFGMEFLDPVTFLPLGHKTTEYAEVVTNDYYPLVRLNEKVPDSLFR